MTKKTNDEFAMDVANHMLMGTPIPDSLIDNLMAGVCEEVKQERERGEAGNSTKDLA